MSVQPTSRSTFTSTIWNSPAKARHSTNLTKWGGPNVNISEGSKVQFVDGDTVWDVARVFDDGSLYLTAVVAGRKITRRVPITDSSWTNIRMVDGKRLKADGGKVESPKGGGPNKTIDPGNIVTLGTSRVRWTVMSVGRGGSLMLQTYNGTKLLSTTVDAQSKYWNSIYSVNG